MSQNSNTCTFLYCLIFPPSLLSSSRIVYYIDSILKIVLPKMTFSPYVYSSDPFFLMFPVVTV